MTVLSNLLKIFDYFPFTESEIDSWHSRISSVTFEPPALGTYLLTVSGWMFSYIITEKGVKKYIPSIAIILLSLFSDSRSGIFIIAMQSLVFGILLVRKRKYHQILIKMITLSMFLVIIIGIIKGKDISEYIYLKATSFSVKNDDHGISNKSRLGIQYTLLQIFLENPISGVGFGQQAFEAEYKYPVWATSNNWEFKHKYLNEKEPSFPPGYNIYLRILAESGIVGFLIFLTLLFLILFTCFKLINRNNKDYLLFFVIFISMVGVYIHWIQTDSFRVFGFWINLALLIKLTGNTKFIIKKQEILPKNSTYIEK